MSEYVFKLPDLGEGTVEAEIIEWHVKPGDAVAEGDIVADVMTDKANIEVPAPVSGRVLRTSGEPGDMVAVGAELMALAVVEAADTDGTSATQHMETSIALPVPKQRPVAAVGKKESSEESPEAPYPVSVPDDNAEPVAAHTDYPKKVRTSPVVRRRAKETGIDLTRIQGSGPRGRILSADLESAIADEGAEQARQRMARPSQVADTVEEIKLIGVRRAIARRMQTATQEVPHFSYVEEVDVSALESLRSHLNDQRQGEAPTLTYLPFIGLAMIRALGNFPQCNAHFDSKTGVIRRFQPVHLGVATQTPDGLKVPVVHHAEARTLWQLAAEITRVADAARTNRASREELTGSTITITSLGRLGGIASTPIINIPEVAIVGVNSAVKRPVVVSDTVQVRRMMNLSSSFDHRFVDGFDAASFIAAIKSLLEQPATLFIDQ